MIRVPARYVLEDELGRGGMGVVFRARDTELDRPVALKFLSELPGDPESLRRLRREATPSYMTPEVLTGGNVDVRADIWSLGVVLFEMLSARLPFPQQSPMAVFSATLQTTALEVPPTVPRPLAEVVLRCLWFEPEERFQHAGAVRSALQSCATGKPAPGPRTERALQPDTLLNELAQIRALRVTSRTSVMHYRHAPKTLPQIARELDVDAVLLGSVQREGDQVRINVQLIRRAPSCSRLVASVAHRQGTGSRNHAGSDASRGVTHRCQVGCHWAVVPSAPRRCRWCNSRIRAPRNSSDWATRLPNSPRTSTPRRIACW